MKKALFWDFDGTLIHGEATFYNALCAALSALNYDIPHEEIKCALTTGCTWYNNNSYVGFTGEKWWQQLFAHFAQLYEKHEITSSAAEEINLRFRAEILDYRTYTVYYDAVEVLYKCSAMGFDNYVLSNNFPELREVAHGLGLTEHIRDFFISSNIGYEKPRPEIFRYAIQAANSPETCFMIGDNPVADIQGGKKAGMTTVLVHNSGDYEADYLCKTLSEIPALL